VIEAFQNLTKTLMRQKEEWMTGISHDLKTPLTAAKGYTQNYFYHINTHGIKKRVENLSES
jgi:signal transduction histidine kinase